MKWNANKGAWKILAHIPQKIKIETKEDLTSLYLPKNQTRGQKLY